MQKQETNLLKERAVNRIIKHMRNVQDNMILLEYNRKQLPFYIKEFELLRRSIKHDTSKFEDNFIIGFSKLPPQKDRTPQQEQEAEKYMSLHRKTERHHSMPESYLDLCEMICDWEAIARRSDNNTSCVWFYENVVLKKVPDMIKYKHQVKFIGNLLRLLKYEKKIKSSN